MIRDDATLAPLLSRLASAREVSLDTEFHSERHYHPRLMLLQLKVDDDAPVLVDALGTVDFPRLCAALAPVRLLVHGGQMDIQILHRLGGLRPREVFDTQVAAGCAGAGYPIRLQELVRRFLEIHIPKTETLSDWSRRPLSAEQLRYAADDVVCLPGLVRAIERVLDTMGNRAIAEACTAELYARTLAPEDLASAWKTVPGAHLLDDAERAALRALAIWRDAQARDRDVPRSAVVSDGLLLDLARRQPRSIDGMRANRRFPSQVWKRDGEALLAVIEGARTSAPPARLHSRPRVWMDCVRAGARVVEASRGVSAELTIDDRQMERIAAGEPLNTWRADALGPEFQEFLAGRASVVMPGRFSSSV